jgi:superfamily I DNA/RNA helicase
MEANSRVTFTGPAGTGKTLLAIEAARRSANVKRKVLLVCFNRLLGDWVELQTAELRPAVTTATLHSYMLQTAGLRVDADSAHTPEFWANELPSKAIDRLLQQPGTAAHFDELIVDEAQDVLKPPYLDFLDLVLQRGWGAGRWKLFGDFEKQAIYADNGIPLEEFLETRSSHAPVYDLRENCRNTPRVAVYTQLLGGLNPYYRKILRPDDGVDPQVIYYKDDAHQIELLAAALRDLLKEGFTLRDITILSPVVHHCAARLLRQVPEWTHRIEKFERRGPAQAGYCSIQAFKGMEAPVAAVHGNPLACAR